jgi:hypothetical protein
VTDILEKGKQARMLVREQSGQSVEDRVSDIAAEIEEHIDELRQIGCKYKDWSFEKGLVDFPANIDGQTVLLCWRSDEENVSWFHRIEDGYAGRTPIPEALLHADSADSATQEG